MTLLYESFLPRPLIAALDGDCVSVPTVPGLRVRASLLKEFPDVESEDALVLAAKLARATRPELEEVLRRREKDRAFVDGCLAEDPTTPVIGAEDDEGRVVIGPQSVPPQLRPVPASPMMDGPQVTLFGPPDTARMAVNAMNALHRRLPDEAMIVAELVASSCTVPRWGADSEDSKTPIAEDLKMASRNLAGCFDGSLRVVDEQRGRVYELADEGLALPVKRIAGLALPDGDHLLDGAPMPLHVVELVQHVWMNRGRREALTLYIPKLENEEEAAYLATVIRKLEDELLARDESYQLGSIRVILVIENPRAIFRIQHMADALYPYFLGGSLGWHDFLASTARLFRRDPSYRIPVKADPDIVIRNIRESHAILVEALSEIGGLKIGGMYGILYQSGDAASFTASMIGYIRDVITQLKRGLDGFWVAHPDFVRVGIALTEAWRQQEANPNSTVLHDLIRALVPSERELSELFAFVDGPDIAGLDADDPDYLRAVLAAEVGLSTVIANDDPEEVRYNVFQALQYLADWLCGRGCVALPAKLKLGSDPVFVRVMDDLATTERSRWEVWAEVAHGRVSLELFEEILAEEIDFIRSGADTPTKRTEVAWEGEAARWYPIAVRLLRQLMTSSSPPEFVTELLMPFAYPAVREAADPWEVARALCPGKFD